ncbi:MAG TPA: hypothetical protein ENI41_03615, partial [Deltaproteobacteria bacterium]|nr:hypothetical protein [Deltaproteobacteria bacterium]
MKVFQPQKRYRLHPGYIAWILHRVTGILLGLYLFLHIWVIHYLAQGEQALSLIHIYIFDIAKYGDTLGLRMTMATNGTLLTRELVEKMLKANIQRVSISIDGATAESHDAFRKVEGS